MLTVGAIVSKIGIISHSYSGGLSSMFPAKSAAFTLKIFSPKSKLSYSRGEKQICHSPLFNWQLKTASSEAENSNSAILKLLGLFGFLVIVVIGETESPPPPPKKTKLLGLTCAACSFGLLSLLANSAFGSPPI